jgi:hypothetical protein
MGFAGKATGGKAKERVAGRESKCIAESLPYSPALSGMAVSSGRLSGIVTVGSHNGANSTSLTVASFTKEVDEVRTCVAESAQRSPALSGMASGLIRRLQSAPRREVDGVSTSFAESAPRSPALSGMASGIIRRSRSAPLPARGGASRGSSSDVLPEELPASMEHAVVGGIVAVYDPVKEDLIAKKLQFQPLPAHFQEQADVAIPPIIAAHIGKRFLTLRTCGDGACALHAAFGHPRVGSGLFLACAREHAVALLGPSYEAVCIKSGHHFWFEAIADSLWTEFARPSFEGKRSVEGEIFMRSLTSLSPQYSLEVKEYWQRRSESLHENDHAKEALLASSRLFFTELNEARIIRPLAFLLDFIPTLNEILRKTRADLDQSSAPYLDFNCDFLHEPWHEDSHGSKLVRGTRIPYPANGPASKYEALFDSRPCFDPLRYSFLVAGGLGSFLEGLSGILCSVSNHDDVGANSIATARAFEAHVRSYRLTLVTIDAPVDFAARTWAAYLKSISDKSYYFSVEELLLLARCACVNVVVFKQHIGNTIQYAGGSIENEGATVVFTKIKVVENSIERVRSHYERVVLEEEICALKVELLAEQG